ncbi:ATP-binding cassette domain-containing protein [Clostridium oryzae]|uniref:Putative ABC transporter ATP-binding protein n=1 Tax=Clostridium oryzae TaxID=1450648 RepID=A0A1V4IWF1_9CLOT|nr:ABC transporter ATP-binding protein [Clostridium oryzae]OPJ64382.1 putative ABC transporter ATP-binding protein [Clostridium oryzae]
MEEKNKNLKYSVLNNIIFLLKDMWKAHPLLIVFILLQAMLSVVSPLFGIYFPKITVDLVTASADKMKIIYTLTVFGLLMAVSMALSNMAGNGKYMMYNDMRTYYQIKLFLQSLSCDYIYVESAEGQTKYERAVSTLRAGDWSGTSKMTVAMINIFVSIICFIIYSGIISTLNIYIILSVVNYFSIKNAQKYQYNHKDEEARFNKKLDYVEWTAKDVKYGKDIRLYGMSSWLIQLREILLEGYIALSRKIKNRYFVSGVVNAFTLFLRDGIAYAYLIWSVVKDNISIGNFVLYFGAITGFSGFVGSIIGDINELNGANLQMNDMRAFLDNTDEPEPYNMVDILSGENMSIEFSHVYFSYDKNSEPVLKDFSISIKKGEKIALVGVNGAGKTTIIKLLCGFYKPDRGQISIDGININNFRKKDLYKLFSAVFQDVYIPPFTVAENVSLQIEKETDMELVKQCLKKVGLYDKINQYPDSIRTPMTKEVKDGIVLSGGQQQKLLMARALYKNAPILILDEPTAALDPIAESETYHDFYELSQNKTAIYISHRLASTRFCNNLCKFRNRSIITLYNYILICLCN